MSNKVVIKYDGTQEPFDSEKLFRWSKYAAKVDNSISWGNIALETYKRLPLFVKSEDIHQTMIAVLEETKNPAYTKLVARLEIASLRKNIERELGVNVSTDPFHVIYSKFISEGIWCGKTMPAYSDAMSNWWETYKKIPLQSWQVQQFSDKYALRLDGLPIEVPHLAAIGVGLALIGDNPDGYKYAASIIEGKINLPTPLINGCRNGDFDTVSCSVIEAGDNTESISVADHLAMRLTAKKAGIGIKYNTRSKGAPVKGGRVSHLGKHSIYKSLAGSVSLLTQVTRGGSATVSYDAIDPEAYNIALWKSQRSDIRIRLDWLDFSFCFNDAFLDAVVHRKDWYFFSMEKAPEIYEAFPTATVEEFNNLVDVAVSEGRHNSKISALELISHILELRQETGRIYFSNLSRMNEHTPFNDAIRLSNLCQLAA